MSESYNLATQPREAASVAQYDLEADVVIVGLGVAGVCAALEAVAFQVTDILEAMGKDGVPVVQLRRRLLRERARMQW